MTITSSKATLIVFQSICGVILVNWIHQGASFNGAYFDREIVQPTVAELQKEGKSKHYLWTLLHMDNTKSHTSKYNLARMEELHLKCTADRSFSSDIALSDIFI
jgi:hypothetical protein